VKPTEKPGKEATNKSTANKRKRLSNHQITKPFISRGDWIRTSDHTPPRGEIYFFR